MAMAHNSHKHQMPHTRQLEQRLKTKMDTQAQDAGVVVAEYTNWRGVRRTRYLRPLRVPLEFISTQYHPEPQWIMQAIDVELGEVRDFALAGFHSWRQAGREFRITKAPDGSGGFVISPTGALAGSES